MDQVRERPERETRERECVGGSVGEREKECVRREGVYGESVCVCACVCVCVRVCACVERDR